MNEDSVTMVTSSGERVTVAFDGVITVEDLDGTVSALTVREVVAFARTRRSHGVQIGDFNRQDNHFT